MELQPDAAEEASPSADDPLGAEAIRAATLKVWADSPSRFREDANAEEDAALAGYRDRVLVELLQNASDAATAAGGHGRVLVRLRPGQVSVANSGVQLTSEGLQALCSLRASAKRGDANTIGRFGTGFASVVAVSDEPSIVSGAAAVRWSTARARDDVAAVPALRGELETRRGQLPLLRLPYSDAGAAPAQEGYDTEVRLPLRPGVRAAGLLEQLTPALMLLLTGVDELVVDDGDRVRTHRLRRADDSVELDGVSWLRQHVRREVPAELLDDAATELRTRTTIGATVLWPEGGWPADIPKVLHAPTPTDEPITLGALVAADVPLEAHRRRTVPGRLRSFAIEVAADAVDALARRIEGPEVLRLVPTGLPAGPLDAELSELVVASFRMAPPTPGRRTLDVGRVGPAVRAVVEEVVGDLLPDSWPIHSDALRVLGISPMSTADVVDAVAAAGSGQPASWWRRVYDALAELPDREALAALPVPLAGGGLSSTPRGLLLPSRPVEPELAERLRVADPEAVAPLLLTLGAVAATPLALLEALRPAIEASYDDGDTALAPVVLRLVADAAVEPGVLPWLRDLAVTDADGQIAPAGELVLGGSALDLALRDDAPLGVLASSWLEVAPTSALLAAGVGDGLVVVRGADSVAEVDGGEEFLAAGNGADSVAEVDGGGEPVAVRDLEWLRWPEGLPLLEKLPPETHAYLRWWAASEPLLAGQHPAEVLAPGADPLLRGLYDEAPVSGDLAAALGCRSMLPDDADGMADLLDRLGDPARQAITRDQLRTLMIRVAAVGAPGTAPLSVRGIDAGTGELVCVPPEGAVLVDAPDLLPLLGDLVVVPAPAVLARALSAITGVRIASELAAFEVVSEYPLTVAAVDGTPTPVSWRVTPDGVAHATTPEGLGRAQAWLAGDWPARHRYVEQLRRPERSLADSLETDLEG